MTLTLLLLAALLLAWANGANDNFKGVATLYGSGTLSYRRALAWATLTTALGSLASLLLAAGLVRAFSGKGLVPDAVAAQPAFLTAVGLGAGLTVLLATRLGIPISTTHALVGGLVGAGGVLAGSALNLSLLGSRFLLPLLVSPLLALTLVAVAYPMLRRLRHGLELSPSSWSGLTVEEGQAEPQAAAQGGFMQRSILAAPTLALPTIRLFLGRERPEPGAPAAGADAKDLLDAGHVLSAGAVSFARGLNDTPKLAGLLVVLPALNPRAALFTLALAMAFGGLLHARKVAKTMSEDITEMNAGQGACANVVSALLVIFASKLGVPVSTTHVTCGSLFGLGMVSGGARWGTIGTILGAWLITLPCAALGAGALAWALRT